ncbi:hypothetical protein K8W59_06685 [Nocardioides rotundus]|uniref:hypothetical protein n=1 Tax=Nocardioides rotundus TaxID=1774216 RepID=UPI001CBF10AD|nr:hypothetical protein [Nocardioides rotundus]UAL31151.1 hypothetical protein K8W59_06685 [Nocardioides rotundus]
MTAVLLGEFGGKVPEINEGQLFRVLTNVDGAIPLELPNGNTAKANGSDLTGLMPGDAFLLTKGRIEQLPAEAWPAGDRTGTVVWAGDTNIVEGGIGTLEWCRVCGAREQCGHVPSERYSARLIVIVVTMQVQEVRSVYNPPNPDARITSLFCTLDDLRRQLGEGFEPGDDPACNRCLLACSGLARRPATLADSSQRSPSSQSERPGA